MLRWYGSAPVQWPSGTGSDSSTKPKRHGFMVAFTSARRALECAIAVQRAVVLHKAEHPGEPIRVRIGLHTGEAIKEGEDFFGGSVILALRIASQAQGEQILVSSLLKARVESSGEFKFGELHEVVLKGLFGSHEVFRLTRGENHIQVGKRDTPSGMIPGEWSNADTEASNRSEDIRR